MQKSYQLSLPIKNCTDTPLETVNKPQKIMTYKKRLTYHTPVTRLSPLMAQEKSCLLPYWLQTHHHNIKIKPSSYDPTNHDEMLIERAGELQDQGFDVTVENANQFMVKNETHNIIITGRPDIIAVKNDWVIVEDCKSGRHKKSHLYQLLLYMFLLSQDPKLQSIFKKQIPHGRLIYTDGIIEIPTFRINDEFMAQFHKTLTLLTHPDIPTPQPHRWECQYCTLSDQYCSIKKAIA